MVGWGVENHAQLAQFVVVILAKENLPFAEERILEYVTDFLQMAHAADERYTVRDGINLSR